MAQVAGEQPQYVEAEGTCTLTASACSYYLDPVHIVGLISRLAQCLMCWASNTLL